ncbi:MAG: hypothetical protein Q8Q29_09075 [Actinomycetota bacterium]|nr:hypothetical protein [Actinomycetota bacterium]
MDGVIADGNGRHEAHPEAIELGEAIGIAFDVDGIELDPPGREELLRLGAAASAGAVEQARPRSHHASQGITARRSYLTLRKTCSRLRSATARSTRPSPERSAATRLDSTGRSVHRPARRARMLAMFLTLEEPTRPMRSEAASAGFYQSPGWQKKYPRLQILTIEELLAGKQIERPPANVTFKKAPKAKGRGADQLSLVAEDRDEYEAD